MNVHNVEMKQLFGYSQNIVDGMEYLTHNKIINRTHPSCGVVNSTVPSEFTLLSQKQLNMVMESMI